MIDEPTVFLVDDDQSLREALDWLLNSVQLRVEAFASAPEFLNAYDPERPGCIVLDIRMPGMSGLELQKQLNKRQNELPIIVITGHGDVPMCIRAFEDGAYAFLEKPVNYQRFLDQIQRAIEHDLANRRQRMANTAPNVESLTPREREVMDLIASGRSMKEIASRLAISIQTCSKHRVRILEKMDVNNDVELVRRLLNADAP